MTNLSSVNFNKNQDTVILLITPPFTQLNTPYPATAYIKGFLKSQNINTTQLDLGIEVILKLFTKEKITQLFELVENQSLELSENASRIVQLKNDYIQTVEPVIRFLQYKNPTIAYAIAERELLPEASRFTQLDDLQWAFGTLGLQDKARHIATLYLEDIADFITEAVDPNFGFSRYAESLGLSASSFSPIQEELELELSFIDKILVEILDEKIQSNTPTLICLSVPFPGNLFGAFRCGQHIKNHYPNIKVCMGGGYPNTELRKISDSRVFDYIDFITLDDGERPLLNLLDFLDGKRPLNELKRTFLLQENKVVYLNGSKDADVPFSQTGTPDYSDLPLEKYLSVIEIANPMHRLWSDGRWNKLTMAHGCYWKKCSFCDISLDYIKNYEPVSAQLICDRIEELVQSTGESGFHFVDEAAPPALMKEIALEIIRRKLVVTWWANIRFEQSFSPDLCRLLKASGCIAVSGGLEVASDRLLEKMKKGVTVEQVSQVSDNFTLAGIMVHAYLMYGFPTQTAQETVDSLEMVRQLFENGVIQSAFWHRFAMTAHSPIGLDPKAFQVTSVGPIFEGFAENDLFHEDPEGANHELFGEGLKKSLFNYMHGICFEYPLQDWFDFKIPTTTIPPEYIQEALETNPGTLTNDKSRLVWLGSLPTFSLYEKRKKGKVSVRAKLDFELKHKTFSVTLDKEEGQWLMDLFPLLLPSSKEKITIAKFRESYQTSQLESFELFYRSQAWIELRREGLLAV